MIDAAEREPLPALNLRMLEAQLRQKWLAQAATAEKRRGLRAGWVATAVAAVAFVGVLAVYGSHATPRNIVANAPISTAVNGDTLHAGVVLVAESSPVSVVHSGTARWVLAPHSSARVVALRPCLTLGLDQGRIDADVTPKKESATFAVETRTHRVTVHGTQFSVTIEPSGVLVEVTSGVVVVSPLAQGRSAPTMRLTAPQRILFPSAEVVPTAQTAASPATPRGSSNAATRGSAKQKLPDAPPVLRSSVPQQELPLNPPMIEQETALDFVRAAAAHCFAQSEAANNQAESNVLVHLETQLTLTLAPGGSVQDISFSPPVPEAILSCTFREIRAWAASPSRAGAKASRAIILTR
jgi:hypothetical protein